MIFIIIFEAEVMYCAMLPMLYFAQVLLIKGLVLACTLKDQINPKQSKRTLREAVGNAKFKASHKECK
jgi:hypothetical protein